MINIRENEDQISPHSGMKLSVIIGTLNRPKELLECLKSLKRCINGEFELILINQGSELPAFANDIEYGMRVVSCSPGASKARNAGAQIAKGEYLYFFDDDAYLLNLNVEMLNERNDIYMVRWKERPIPKMQYLRFFLPSLVMLRNSGTPMYIIKKDIFLKSGGFDENFGPGAHFVGGEDSDLALRLLASGAKVEWESIGEFSHKTERLGSEKLLQYAFCRGAMLRKNKFWILIFINFVFFVYQDLRHYRRAKSYSAMKFIQGILSSHD